MDVLSITGVVFILIGAGYLSVLSSVFSGADLATLGKFVLNFALPALILHAMTSRPIGEVISAPYMGAYLFGSVGAFLAGYILLRRGAGAQPVEGTFDGMGMSCANSGFVGYPILLMAMPAIAPTVLALNMIIENLVMIPLVLIMAERATGRGLDGWRLARQIAGRVLRNPITLALAAGLLVSLSGRELPQLISAPVEIVARSSAALSLFVIGGTLAGLPLRRVGTRAPVVVAGKLILHPLLVWVGIVALAGLGYGIGDPALARAGILTAAMPAMAIYPILAGRYGQQDVAAVAMLLMTVLSFVTISAILWMLETVPVG